jgi:cell division protease FtsH
MPERLRLRGDVRRPGRRADPQAVRGGAQERAAIVFIDELDAVGAQRTGHGFSREQDQTLNQLLVELDGFEARDQVIVMGASNRLQDLDAALLRAGRFDRQVLVAAPDLAGREEILLVHTRGKPLAADVDLALDRRQTAG